MKTVYFSFIAVLLLMTAPFAGKANNNSEKETAVISKKQVSVHYAGTTDNSVVFRVALENPAAQQFTLTIKDWEGYVLYQGKFNDAHFAKTIHLLKSTTEMTPTFIIHAGDQKFETSFQVNAGNDSEVIVYKL